MDKKEIAELTYFAPARRADLQELEDQAQKFTTGIVGKLMDAMNSHVLILNGYRQIVFINRRLRELLGLSGESDLLGFRPGEIFACEQSQSAPNGCGTGEECRQCSAVLAILSALSGKRAEDTCRIIRRVDGDIQAIDLEVCATPIEEDGERFVIFAILDISQQHRLRILERTFFHDVLNTAGALHGLLDSLVDDAPVGLRQELEFVNEHLGAMVGEIMTHKDFLAAENGEITVKPQEIKALEMLEAVQRLYQGQNIAQGKSIQVDCAPSISLITDRVLLGRVLGNMLKNALEAEPLGATINLDCQLEQDRIVFRVHNDAVIPQEHQTKLFKGGFSTKGMDRGVGVYSIRLLTERYLGGRMYLESGPGQGTTFFVDLPEKLLIPQDRGIAIDV